MKRTLGLAVALSAALHFTASAVTFTTNATLGAGDTMYDGQPIEISGCTLTVNGSHTFASVLVHHNGVLTHSPATTGQTDHRLDLTVTGNVTVNAGGAITAAGAGYAADNGPSAGAGASHGGVGGGGRPVYGSLLQPLEAGSGGSYDGYWGGGSAGGGHAKLVVQGTLTVEGNLSAAGANSGGHAGAGGSLWLEVGQLAGGGTISADGGTGNGGGGGGGRIAVYYGANNFAGSLTAFGGGGSPRGGPGTILLKADTAAVSSLKLDNGGIPGTWTPLDLPQPMEVFIANGARMFSTVPQTFNTLQIASGGYLVHNSIHSNLNVTVLGDATVAPGGYVYATGQGYAQDSGPGAGPASPGSHGGQGALSSGPTYDSILEPTWKGSGGSYGGYWGAGSAGGGAVRLIVNGTLTVNGAIDASGFNAGGAAGAGGALWLTVGTLAGNGVIAANGGSGNGGGGGGGRVAIYSQINAFAGQVTAFGGVGGGHGGPGTVFLKTIGTSVGSLVLDNNALSGKWTPLAVPEPMHLRLTNGAYIYPSEALVLQSLVVQSNGWLIQNAAHALTNVQLTVLEDATVDPDGALWADGQGYPADAGPGVAVAAAGSHGGVGGAGTGAVYGSILEPTWRGSGGSYSGYWGSSHPGGGAFRLIVNGTLTLNGRCTANGLNSGSSGGAGGSIWLTAGQFTGNGTMSANGGSGNAGGGGGGRIAIYAGTNGFTGLLSTYGGSGTGKGGPGTIFTKRLGQPIGQVVFDNNDLLGTWTPLSLPEPMHVQVARGAQLYPTSSQTFQSLLLQSNAWLIHKAEFANMEVTVLEDAAIEPGTGLWADGQGFPADMSYDGATGPVGGSHGGLGGGAGVRNYDAVDQPILKGSGGGYGGYWGPGAAGGGVIKFTVNGRLMLDGSCTANGLSTGGTGGGAGGSLWLTVGELVGAGGISANGGSANGGGGGGGRVAIYFVTNRFAGPVTAYGRGVSGGAGTVFWKSAGAPLGTVWLDNAGTWGNYTPLDASVRYHLEMSNHVAVITRQPLLVQSLHMAANTRITHLQDGPPLRSDVTVLGDAVIDAGAEISAIGRGYAADTGPGENNGGGSHGGHGGGASGPTYGSESAPADWGSGGSFDGYWGAGSAGGGAMRMTVAGTLTHNGTFNVNANNAAGGGGAGGSIWLTLGRLTGSGAMTANGGFGNAASGGGGRIAILSPDTAAFSGLVVAAAGGAGAGNGTIFYAAAPGAMTANQHSPNGTVTRPVAYVDITFANALEPSSFTAADVTVSTPGGDVPMPAITVTPVGGAIYRVGFPTQTAVGSYQFTVGPTIQDLFGQDLSAAYTGSFAIAQPIISGVVTNENGTAVAGVLLNASDGNSAVSDASGAFDLAVTPGFTGTVTPSRSGWAFVPVRRSYTAVAASLEGENFLAVAGSLTTTITVSKDASNVVLSWPTYAGLRYQLQSTTNLTAAAWTDVGSPLAGTGGTLATNVPLGPSPMQFFRLHVLTD